MKTKHVGVTEERKAREQDDGPEMLVALDPGKWKGGLSIFVQGFLVFATTVKLRERDGLPWTALWAERVREETLCIAQHYGVRYVPGLYSGRVRLISEWQEVYVGRIRTGQHQANPKDLLDCSACVGAVEAALLVPSTRVEPKAWKGQMKKGPCHARIYARLEEMSLLSGSECELDVWSRLLAEGAETDGRDSVGIGLHALKRGVRR